MRKTSLVEGEWEQEEKGREVTGHMTGPPEGSAYIISLKYQQSPPERNTATSTLHMKKMRLRQVDKVAQFLSLRAQI